MPSTMRQPGTTCNTHYSRLPVSPTVSGDVFHPVGGA